VSNKPNWFATAGRVPTFTAPKMLAETIEFAIELIWVDTQHDLALRGRRALRPYPEQRLGHDGAVLRLPVLKVCPNGFYASRSSGVPKGRRWPPLGEIERGPAIGPTEVAPRGAHQFVHDKSHGPDERFFSFVPTGNSNGRDRAIELAPRDEKFGLF